jgi:hypothetical protein
MRLSNALIVAGGLAVLSLLPNTTFGQTYFPGRSKNPSGLPYVSRNAANDASAPLYHPTANPGASSTTSVPRDMAMDVSARPAGKARAQSGGIRSWHWQSRLGKYLASRRSQAEMKRHQFIDPSTGGIVHTASSKPWLKPIW